MASSKRLLISISNMLNLVLMMLLIPSSVAFRTAILISSSPRQSLKLFAQQKKKPRFTQQAHIPNEKKQPGASSSAAGSSRKTTSKRKQVWDSEKSIEDLEENMMKRWGTLESPTSNTKDKKTAGSTDLRRAVLDPWQDDADKKAFPVREYYDQDDEGFEYVGELDDGDDDDEDYILEDDTASKPKTSSNNKIKIDHLISPKPVGGRGTNVPREEAQPAKSYFFNDNKPQQSPNGGDDKKSKSKVTAQAEEAQSKQDMQKDRPASRIAKPLLDEDGVPILMTVAEALYRFQETVKDESVMEMMDSAELPIVAFQVQSWQELGITSEVLLKNLNNMNCPTPLAVQEKACPPVLTGNDVLVGTYTGSGKTLAFLTPLIQRLLWNSDDDIDKLGLAVLVVAPGRELASQIVSVARELIQDTGLTVQLAIGGTTFTRNLEQIRKRKPNIIVGTPGRIAELVVGKPGEKSGRLKVASLQSLVMDEFDALLEYKPHRDPTQAVMHSLKRRHGDALQSILCSATAADVMDSTKVVEFLRPGYATAMTDKDDVLVHNQKTQVSRTVLHGVVHVQQKRLALDTVRRILHTDPVPQQILIFVESSRKVDIVVEKLADRGIIAAPLHGGMGSEKMDRAEVSKALREGYVGIVVATELAARGLDAPLLTHVINLDLPTDASHYAHRAGRCGRGGRPGVVINITTSNKERNVPQRFAESLGVEMHSVEPRGGKLIMVDSTTQKLD